MTTVVLVITGLLVGLGGFFCVTGAVGILRFPDAYTRLHAASVTDTLGAGLIVLGLLVWTALGEHGWLPALVHGEREPLMAGLVVTFKLVSILFFMWISGTTASHAVAKAAWLDGLKPWRRADGEDGGPSKG